LFLGVSNYLIYIYIYIDPTLPFDWAFEPNIFQIYFCLSWFYHPIYRLYLIWLKHSIKTNSKSFSINCFKYTIALNIYSQDSKVIYTLISYLFHFTYNLITLVNSLNTNLYCVPPLILLFVSFIIFFVSNDLIKERLLTHYKNRCILTRVYSTRYCRHASNLTRVFGDTCQIVQPSKMDTCI
jgi:hypothetical protein